MITLRKYNIEDWAKIDDAIEPFTPPMPMEKFLEMTENGIAITGVEKGSVMACGGIMYLNDTNGMVWLKISKECLIQSFGWARTICETFRLMKKSVGDLKISTYVLSDFCKGEKLARLIGLRKTEETEEYNGNTYHKFAQKYTAVI